MLYSKKVMKHFKNPHNQGVIKNADAIGQVGNPGCGDVMKLYLKIKKQKNLPVRQAGKKTKKPACRTGRQEEIIKDIKFETLGCAAAIAVSSAMTDIAKGKTLDEAMKITKDKIVKDLGGLPSVKIHCSMLSVEALHQAIEKYKGKN
jgi:nitrogen fixation NifU-like protein